MNMLYKFATVTLGDLIELEYGTGLPAQKRGEKGYPVFGANGIIGYHTSALVPGPGIVVGRKGSVGRISWSEGQYWPIDTTYYVVPKSTLNLRWLFHLLAHQQRSHAARRAECIHL